VLVRFLDAVYCRPDSLEAIRGIPAEQAGGLKPSWMGPLLVRE
jgi:hypothetical protein